jgi:hypothetical protein
MIDSTQAARTDADQLSSLATQPARPAVDNEAEWWATGD